MVAKYNLSKCTDEEKARILDLLIKDLNSIPGADQLLDFLADYAIKEHIINDPGAL